MSQAVESVDADEIARVTTRANQMAREAVRTYYQRRPSPPPRDPSYSFERKDPDQYPSKTVQNPEKGSSLSEVFTKDKRASMTWLPGEGKHAGPTWKYNKKPATGEIDKSGLTSGSLMEKFGSVKK